MNTMHNGKGRFHALRVWLLAAATLLVCPEARAQITPEQQAEIEAYVTASNVLANAYAAGPRREPYAEERERSQRLSVDQRAQAQALFASAFTLWQAGDYEPAETGFRRGLAIDPANGAANFYLGDILYRQMDFGGAHARFSRTVIFAPNSPEALRAEERPTTSVFAVSTETPIVFAPASPQVAFRDCAQCPEMITIPAGELSYGDHTLAIAPFAAGRFEVTFDEWAVCVRGGGCTSNPSPSDEGAGRGSRPVIHVNWNDTQEYVRWLSVATGNTYRLLSSAEWEFAARAGTSTRFSWGDNDPVCVTTARNGAQADCSFQTRPVGSFREARNAFGLFDVHGNVCEWVEYCYTPVDCSVRVMRAGARSPTDRDL